MAEPTPEVLRGIGENIDRQVIVSPRGRTLVHALYSAARERQGDEPLTLLAARRLAETVTPGSFVFISSGYVIPGFDTFGETDGPSGSAALARVLALGLKAKPVILVEDIVVDIYVAVCRAAGLNVVTLPQLRGLHVDVNRAVAVAGFPVDLAEAEREADRLMDSYSPSAMVAVEKNGPSDRGEYHMFRGYNRSAHTSKAHVLFHRASEQGLLTIGIGDLGNEIGMGKIRDVVHQLMPVSVTCKCPCGAGSADSTIVDVAIPAEMSNWGAYGIAACMSAILGRPEIMHDGDTESRMLRAAAAAGAQDGVTSLVEPSADGVPERLQVALVELLRGIAQLPVYYAGQPPFYYGLE